MKTNRIIPKLPRKIADAYRARFGSYLRSMLYYKKMLDENLISEEEYSEIELVLLKKYQLGPKSLERMDLKSIAERDVWKSKNIKNKYFELYLAFWRFIIFSRFNYGRH